MDPALMCTSTGDGEQTINQIQTRGEHGRFIFNYGLMVKLAITLVLHTGI
jgi:hypothetical protein